MTRRCSWCGYSRPLSELLLFWPVSRPLQVGSVCRPTMYNHIPAITCFRRTVGSAFIHAIAPAVEQRIEA